MLYGERKKQLESVATLVNTISFYNIKFFAFLTYLMKNLVNKIKVLNKNIFVITGSDRQHQELLQEEEESFKERIAIQARR